MTVLDDMIRNAGMTPEDYSRVKATPRAFGRDSVAETAELKRILALPRRSWEGQADEFVEALTGYLRAPGGTQRLRPVQAAALVEMHDFGGLLGLLRCGAGKSLVSLLGFIVMESKRPLLLVPAKLVEKTRRDMDQLRKHWLIPPVLQIKSYEILGREQSASLLAEIKPDVIIADEAHRLKNTKAAVTRRVKRWMEEHPETRMVAMSGTITKRSLHDYYHLAAWCLKRTNPTPTDFNDRMSWSFIIDEKRGDDAAERVNPGALIKFCNDEERELYTTDPVRAVRKGYRRRLVETPGVIATQDGALGMSLVIDSLVVEMPELRDDIRNLKQMWLRPDGEPIMDAIELWRHLREMACGFFYRWNPKPPEDWLKARRAWAKAVREILRNNRSGLDSEGQIKRSIREEREAAKNGARRKYPAEDDTLAQWEAVEPTFTPKTEAVWRSDKVIQAAAKWMEEEKGIVWVEHQEFGKRLSQVTGVPYYQRGGVNQAGKPIEDHPPGTTLIASIASNAEGRNLQAWNTNLVVSPPTSGAQWEQLVSRTHRDGQEADEVTITIVVSLQESVHAFDRARSDARFITDTTGQEQRLVYATMNVIDASLAPTGM